MSDSVPDPLFLLPDGRGVWIYPLTYGRARISIGTKDGIDDGW